MVFDFGFMSTPGEIRIPLQGQAGTDGKELSIPLTHKSSVKLLDDIARRLRQGRGFAVATINLDHVVKLRGSAVFRDAYLRHSHIVADGNPIVWLARLAGQDIDLVPGSELVEPIARQAARNDVPVGLFGACEESLAAAASALKARHPGLRIADCISPPSCFDPSGEIAEDYIDAIAQSDARLWFLALGAPKQELFAARASERLGDRGFLSIGAGLDFISGQQIRAPRIVRRMALEWAWRMAANPMRLGPRYARCFAALPGLFGAALRQRRESRRA
ncbi:WecB/TagA/CpsF family glycosyltransferase [Tropicimonas sp. TH_r6]|uniref:WecB/TagA/CpsF family glycosyltransferase n=1 Tax=Tropicimonas sp. TH_r6 TaxID=3082085 RepID=UPI002953B3BA|nr:WecB/TagA/CpsF family glycosyltransferase [Tropicimonas sp. TH_r6]MDV7141174.1 WecB/TagA/CpsF family glycosyltransferase [Tropicimonas sp. TH_r6]